MRLLRGIPKTAVAKLFDYYHLIIFFLPERIGKSVKSLLTHIVESIQEMPVRYIYKCADCGHRGAVNLAVDCHEDEVSECELCCGSVTMEWDGAL